MGSIQGGTMILGVPGNRGAFLFPRRAHLLTTCKTGGGIPPCGQARALFTNCLLAISPEGAGNAAGGHSLCSRLYVLLNQQNDVVAYCHPIPPSACDKPATGSFIAAIGMSCFPTHLFSLLKKRNRKMKGR